MMKKQTYPYIIDIYPIEFPGIRTRRDPELTRAASDRSAVSNVLAKRAEPKLSKLEKKEAIRGAMNFLDGDYKIAGNYAYRIPVGIKRKDGTKVSTLDKDHGLLQILELAEEIGKRENRNPKEFISRAELYLKCYDEQK